MDHEKPKDADVYFYQLIGLNKHYIGNFCKARQKK